MRVAIDVSPLAQTRAGTARYLKGLTRELERRDDVAVSTRSFGGRSRLSTLARDGVWYPFLLGRESAADILRCPTYRGPLRSRAPLVVTVHDLAVLRHPEAFNRWTRTYSPGVVPTVLRAARRVIAVSDFTRRELIELLGVPDEKIRVVPNAVDDEFTREGPAEAGDYVLAVGTLEPRKNLERLVEAVGPTDRGLWGVGARGWGGGGGRGRGDRRGLPGSHRVSPMTDRPLVLVDADVLGRRRTGDETYVTQLLRELPAVAEDLRLVAVTRAPELVPDGIEALRLPARSQELRMAAALPRLLRRPPPARPPLTQSLPAHCPAPAER